MITLKKNADRRIRKGHLWIFSNEIKSPPMSELEPGSIHEISDSSGEFMGMAYANPKSLITARLLARRKIPIDHTFFEQRIGSALELRKRISSGRDAYRLVFSDSDLLPGLIVDRYADYLVVQSLTAGMDALLEQVVEVLADLIAPSGIFARNDSRIRGLEGIPLEKRPVFGSVPDAVTINSMGLQFLVNIQEGQKTGFFLDQEANRDLMKKYVLPGARVLDLFSYTGGWGIHAAAAGAAYVAAVDSSRASLDFAEINASLNNVESCFTAIRDQVVDYLKKTKESWDVIIADPPSYIKSRAKIKEGRRGYIDLNRRALGKLSAGGILVTCSCSHHLSREDFEDVLLIASQQSGRRTRILEVRGQGPDHPVLLSMPETRYLKVMVLQVI